MADRLGCSYQQVYRWSNGLQPIPEPIAADLRTWEPLYEETKAKLLKMAMAEQL